MDGLCNPLEAVGEALLRWLGEGERLPDTLADVKARVLVETFTTLTVDQGRKIKGLDGRRLQRFRVRHVWFKRLCECSKPALPCRMHAD